MNSVNICEVVDKLVNSANLRDFQSGVQLSLLRMKTFRLENVNLRSFVCLLPNHSASNNKNIKSIIMTNTKDYNILLMCINT